MRQENFKQIQLASGTYCFVTVSELAKNISILSIEDDESEVAYDVANFVKYVLLPPGQWSIIGKASELKEEDWKGIVEEKPFVFALGRWNEYKDYRGKENWAFAKDSGLSLIAKENRKPETTLILKLNQPC